MRDGRNVIKGKLRCRMYRIDDGFRAECIDLGLVAEGETGPVCYRRIREAIDLYCESAAKSPIQVYVPRSPWYPLQRLIWWLQYTFFSPEHHTLWYHFWSEERAA